MVNQFKLQNLALNLEFLTLFHHFNMPHVSYHNFLFPEECPEKNFHNINKWLILTPDKIIHIHRSAKATV